MQTPPPHLPIPILPAADLPRNVPGERGRREDFEPSRLHGSQRSRFQGRNSSPAHLQPSQRAGRFGRLCGTAQSMSDLPVHAIWLPIRHYPR